MLNIINLTHEIRNMNDALIDRLDAIIGRLDKLIALEQKDDLYGDGR